MKLYTEEQVRQAWNAAYIDALSIDEEDYKPNFYDNFIKTITPIELPRDDEIENLGGSGMHKAYNAGLKDGAKWLKEQILKQNK